MDPQLDIESPPNLALSFANRVFEEENQLGAITSTPEPRGDSRIFAISHWMIKKKEEKRRKGNGRNLRKEVRNGLFFGALFLVLLALVGLGVRHWTQQEHLDTELGRLWSSQEHLELEKALVDTQEHHLEWQRNETRARLEHIELQRKMLEHTRKENASVGERLEEASSILELCKSSIEETMKNYWKRQEYIWKQREDIQLMRRRLRVHGNHAKVQAELLGAHGQGNQSQWERMAALREALGRKEDELKGLELEAGQWEMLERTLNESLAELGGRMVARRAEMEMRDSKLHKLEHALNLVRLMNETQSAKLDLAKSLQDQLAQKDEQIRALENLAHAQGQEETVIRKIFLDSKQQSHKEKLRKKEDQIGEMQKEIVGLKATLEEKQKDIENARQKLDRWNRCYYRHWC